MRNITNVGLAQSRRIVDTVPGDSDDTAQSLDALDDDELLLWGGAGKHQFRVSAQHKVQLVRRHLLEHSTRHHGGPRRRGIHLVDRVAGARGNILHGLAIRMDDADGLGDGLGRDRVVASHLKRSVDSLYTVHRMYEAHSEIIDTLLAFWTLR